MARKSVLVFFACLALLLGCKFGVSTKSEKPEEMPKLPRPVGYDTAFLVKGDEVHGRLETMNEKEIEFFDVYGKKHKWQRSEVQRIEFQKLRAGFEAQKVQDLKDELLEEILKRKAKEEDYPNATYVVLYEKTQIKFDGEGFDVVTRYIAQVMQDAGRYSVGNRAIWYLSDRSEVEILWARTILPDGSIKHILDNAIEDGSVYPNLSDYNLLRKHKYALSEMSVGAVADVCTKVRFKKVSPLEPFYVEFLFGETEPILHKEVIVEYKTGAPVKTVLNRKPSPVVSYEKCEENNKTIERYVSSEIKALPRESDMPPLSEIVPSVVVCYSERDWSNLAKTYFEKLKTVLKADEGLIKKTTELTKDCATDEEKAKRLYRFLVCEKDYTEIGASQWRYEPHPAAISIQKSQLNGLDKVALFVAMLRASSIDAQFLLVRGRDRGRFVEEAVSLGAFEDGLVLCKLDGKETYVSLTTPEVPFGYIPGKLQGGTALVVDPTGATKPLITVPILSAKEEMFERTVEASIEADGLFKAKVKLTVTGSKEAVWRKKAVLKPEELQRDMIKFVKGVDTRAVLDDMRLSNLGDPTKPLEIEYAYHIPDWALKAGEKLLVFKLPEINYSADEIETEERASPIWWNTRSLIRNRYAVSVPENFTIRYVSTEEFKMEDSASGLSYNGTFKTENGKIVFEDEAVRNSLSLEPLKYPAYVAMLSTRAKVAQEWIIVESK